MMLYICDDFVVQENHQIVACLALECVANSCSDPWQVLTALRCLIRLALASPQQEQGYVCVSIDVDCIPG